MPALSPTMEMGTLAKWYIKEGQNILAGDILADIETDKATMEFEAIEDGTITSLLVSEGTTNIPVNQAIASSLQKMKIIWQKIKILKVLIHQT
jgi:pyruvate dehydrogenase E1 component beta subunit